MQIKMKILIPMVILTIVVASAILVSNILLFSNYVDSSMSNSMDEASKVAAFRMDSLQAESHTASLYIAGDRLILEALAKGDRDALLARATQLQKDTGVEFCTIMDPSGNVLVRSHEPDNYGDSLASQINVQSAMAGKEVTLIEKGSAVRLSIRSGAPIFDNQNRIVGISSVGFRLDTDTFVDSVKQLLNVEVTVFLEDERVSTTVIQGDGTRAIGTKADADISQTVLAGNTYRGHVNILEHEAIAEYTPIVGANGNAVGMLFVGQYLTEKTATVQNFLQSGLLIILILLAISVAMILLIARSIVAPIAPMVEAAHSLAAGDTRIHIQCNTKDEMRNLADAFNEMIDNSQKQTEIIEAIAQGDLTVLIEPRSGEDHMNIALASMLTENNDVFSQIVGSAHQVSSGAQQMANSSQILAQGTTRQASNVEKLSHAISEVDDKTKESADMASKAAALANQIKSNAEKGSEQMTTMVQAVKEINEASQSIGKIIKVIDDIAFQTNILALNAAVEAARAGQHGKGFAVVADEVRSLAAKSAEAAKDTGAIIENSIAKAELGARIADETAASLKEIVTGINESNQIVGEIAESSKQQSASITHLNDGIGDMAQIIQENSTTADESASASEEMSSQAMLLQNLVSHFKLKSASGISEQSLRSSSDSLETGFKV